MAIGHNSHFGVGHPVSSIRRLGKNDVGGWEGNTMTDDAGLSRLKIIQGCWVGFGLGTGSGVAPARGKVRGWPKVS
jgi:hypothetical protein